MDAGLQDSSGGGFEIDLEGHQDFPQHAGHMISANWLEAIGTSLRLNQICGIYWSMRSCTEVMLKNELARNVGSASS